MIQHAVLATLCASLLGVVATPTAQAAAFEVDPVHSSLIYRIGHLGAGYHYGFIEEFEGSFVYDPDDIDGASVHITAQAASINSLNRARDEHLRSADFFDVAEFATISFHGDQWERTGEGEYAITGIFSLLGVEREVTVNMSFVGEAVDRNGRTVVGFEGGTVITRSEFGMNYGLAMLGDEVTLIIAIEGIRQDSEE